MTKQELREEALWARKKISKEVIASASSIIREMLIAQSWYIAADVVHCYASIHRNNEIDTWPILETILEDGKELVMSRMSEDQALLTHYKVNSTDELEANSLGIYEPTGGTEVAPEKLDLVLTPMAACDTKGNRIGYGAGYYDRFLKDVKGEKAGLCLQQFIYNSVPSEAHDIPMDWIITEDGLLKCG